jgi:cell division protein FtsZ
VTKPFLFEGARRMRSSEAGIAELQQHVDTLIIIPNQNLFLVANPNTTFKEAFLLADEVLQQGVRGITDLMVMPGLINLDFADVRSVMHEMGKAMMGTGEAEGDGRALEAAERAISNPLLDGVSMQGAKGVIISITGGDDMRLMEVDEAANHIRELVDQDANIIWGSAFNENLNGKIRVSVVATGIDQDASAAAPQRSYSYERPAAAPVAAAYAAPVAAAEPEPEVEEALELTAPEQAYEEPVAEVEAEAETDTSVFDYSNDQPEAEVAEQAEDDGDMLELGDAHVAEEEQESPVFGTTAVEEADDVDQLPPPPRVGSGGGTLFERMSSLSRGLTRNDDDKDGDDDSSVNIPRFLDRQSNN